MNEKVYIHEFIDITKQNRARYMHHMAANWSPLAQEQRHQLCYGVWGVVGSTGRWPQVVNIWEEDGFAGLARSFGTELGHATLQDPALAKWWAAAADLRSGGFDRLLVPHPDTLTIEALCASGATSEIVAHELITVRPGTARQFLDSVMAGTVMAGTGMTGTVMAGTGMTRAAVASADHGWRLAGAWWTAMRNEDEAILLWSIPNWESWASMELDLAHGADVLSPGHSDAILGRERILLAAAPLCPFRTGRQPSRDDRTDWVD